jgi:hypothetical protein
MISAPFTEEASKGLAVLRGLLAPWGHPLYTSLTGIGVGIARETPKPWLKVVAPIGFYFMAVTLHGTWNTMATILPALIHIDPLYVMVPLYSLLLLFFLGIVFWLVVREGRALRSSLEDEVHIGNLAREHLELVCSPVGRIRASLGAGGPQARHIIRVAIRLGMAKWHFARAMKAQKGTFSMDAIVPLRQELLRLRQIQPR